MSCKCQSPKKIRNEAHGKVFYVCAKSQGGCGEEIGGGDKPLIDTKVKSVTILNGTNAKVYVNGKFIGRVDRYTFDPRTVAKNIEDEVSVEYDLSNPIMEIPALHGPCEYNCCGKPGIRSRQNTQYEDDERNYGTYCEEHQKDVDEYWAEMWRDYWSDRL